MRTIHWKGVLLGGLLAGFVANLLQFTVNRLYLFRAWDTATGTIGHSPLGTFRGFLLAMMTVLGSILAMGLYAVFKPLFGPGFKTSALAGGVFWLLASLFPVTLWSLSGTFPALPLQLLAMHLTTYLGIALVATMLGAWPYRKYDTKTQG